MKTHPLRLALLPSLMVAIAACDTAPATGPDLEDDLLVGQEQLALAVLADADATEAGIALAEIPMMVTEDDGGPFATAGRSSLVQARLRFEEARRARAAGDDRRALARARAARALLAEVLERSGGQRAVVAAIERAEALASEVGAEPEAYTDPGALEADLTELAVEARIQLDRGDWRGAVGSAVVAEQTRQLRRRSAPDRDRVELALALGRTAIDLATRLLPDAPEPQQLRFLRTAERHLRAAVALDEAGHPTRAIHQAELAVWSALKAVVLPGGVSEEEQRQILDLATELLADARATQPQGVKAELLELSGRLLEVGREQLEAGNPRGVATLWGSAVISSWLIS